MAIRGKSAYTIRWLAQFPSLDSLLSQRASVFASLVTGKKGDVGCDMNDLLVQNAARAVVGQGCIFGCKDKEYWSCGDDGVR